MKILITGGAGYIGSHMTKYLQNKNLEVTVLDNLSTGHLSSIEQCEFIEVDLRDSEELEKKLKNRKFDCVMHFAAKSIVSESKNNPLSYYENNISGSINLLKNVIRNDIESFIFSSSAAVYGQPKTASIKETHNKEPINTYGKTKLYVENLLNDISINKGLKVTSLRYFNAAGADESGEIGEDHFPETHLIPSIFNAYFNKSTFNIYGDTYDTADGTCIRDYVHVNDLADAHFKSFQKHQSQEGFKAYNLGNEKGFSVMEIFLECQKVIGESIQYKVQKKRDGDPNILVANASLAKEQLMWNPQYSNIKDIINTAYLWHRFQHEK